MLTDIKDTVKDTAYALTHLGEVKKSIYHAIDEKGGSYVAGCITGELILTAVGGGSVAKAAKSSESMVGATKISPLLKKESKRQQIVEKSTKGEEKSSVTAARSNQGADSRIDAAKHSGDGVVCQTSGNSVIDYSKRSNASVANDFNIGAEVRTVVQEDMILVQYSSDAPNASLRYWTTVDEANGISTIDDYMDKMALSSEWGNRNVVKVARVSKGTNVTHAIGTAKPQNSIIDPRPGNGKQILFNEFDTNWITEVRKINN